MAMSLFDLVPTSWLAPVVGVAGLALAVGLGVQTMRVTHLKLDLAEVQAAWAKDRAQAAERSRQAEAEARAKEQAWAQHQKELDDANDQKLQALRADIAIRDAAAGRLQQRVAALVATARIAATGAGVEQGSPPASDPAGMLADVLGRCIERVRLLATVADERGAAGGLCEQEHDAVTTP
jgi:hypothetical protein